MRKQVASPENKHKQKTIQKHNRQWFNRQLLTWFALHGRKDLPWQQNPTPYRVWVSEIMLQQTQVNTVIPYYQRFMERFPDIGSLATANIDDVLYHWSGLGYYARGRNLFRTARIIHHQYNSEFPLTLKELEALPGIGRSTAGAILALSAGQCQIILDGNVKRVLSRFHTIEGWPGDTKNLNILWDIARQYTPKKDTAAYTQAIMDLGATICTRSNPACDRCPLEEHCNAHQQHRETDFPFPKPRKSLPIRKTMMLILSNKQGHVLLEKRPPTGIWGGLWSFPEFQSENSDEAVIEAWCKVHFNHKIKVTKIWPVMRHTFSHFHLHITPVQARLLSNLSKVMDDDNLIWYNPESEDAKGMAAPVKKLFDHLIIAL